MQLRVTYATLSIILIIACAGCGGRSAPGDRVIIDDLGRPVNLTAASNRVITLAPSLTEMVFAAGAGDKLVGVGVPDDYPPAVDSLPRYATYPVDFEAIAALEPDLVLATDQVNSQRDAETLEALGIATFFLSFRTIDDIFAGLTTIGTLLDTEEHAEAAVDSLRRGAEAIRSRTAAVESRPTVLFLIGQETLFSFGTESYIHEMIEAAGGRSITSTLNVRAPVLSEEFVLKRAPDVIMGPWDEDPKASTLLRYHPSWEMVSAIRNGRVYGVDPSLVTRPGPRLIEGMRQMARKLHPTIFDQSPEMSPTP